jgi:hypothetical protein
MQNKVVYCLQTGVEPVQYSIWQYKNVTICAHYKVVTFLCHFLRHNIHAELNIGKQVNECNECAERIIYGSEGVESERPE